MSRSPRRGSAAAGAAGLFSLDVRGFGAANPIFVIASRAFCSEALIFTSVHLSESAVAMATSHVGHVQLIDLAARALLSGSV